MKKINQCKDGGYKKMPLRTLGILNPIECPACLELMQDRKFNQSELESRLQNPQPIEDKPAAPDADAEQVPQDDAESVKQKKKKVGKRTRQIADEQEEEEEARALAKEYEPDIILLPKGSEGKKVPYRCLLCSSAAQPDGKVGEIGKLKKYMVKRFLNQHVETDTHQWNLSNRRDGNGIAEVDREKVKCEAISLGHPMQDSALHKFKEEFETWAVYANLEATAAHTYLKDSTQGCWTIPSKSCLKEMEENTNESRQVCLECRRLLKSRSIVRSPIRFAR